MKYMQLIDILCWAVKRRCRVRLESIELLAARRRLGNRGEIGRASKLG
jgi:hypothetical protein